LKLGQGLHRKPEIAQKIRGAGVKGTCFPFRSEFIGEERGPPFSN